MSRKFMGEAPLMEKKSFIKEGEPTIASYDWTDIADGTGVIEFYGGGIADNTPTFKFLFDSRVFRTTGIIEFATATGTSGFATYASQSGGAASNIKLIDLTFQTKPLNIPRRIGGNCYFEIPAILVQRFADNSTSMYFKIKLYVSDGTTDVLLLERQTRTISRSTEGSNAVNFVLEGDVADTNIKIGSFVKVVVEGYGTKGADNTIAVCMGHDPLSKERSFTINDVATKFEAGDSSFIIRLPFRIEI
jgi:hypothetical protein